MSRPLFDRKVTHEQARVALHAFIATQTRSTTDRHARMSIPAQSDDDDLVLGDYIRQQEAKTDAAPETDAVGACSHANAIKREGEVQRWCGDCGAIYVDDYSGGEWLLPARAQQPTEQGR